MLRERACVCAHWLRTFFLQKYTDSVAACFSVSVCGFVSVHLALYIYYRCAQHVFILLTFVSGFLPREIYSIIWGGKSYQVRSEREKGRRICCVSLSLMINLHSFVSENRDMSWKSDFPCSFETEQHAVVYHVDMFTKWNSSLHFETIY